MKRLRRTWMVGVAVAALAAAMFPGMAATAATVVPQAGPNPIVISPGGGKDDLTQLLATLAERDSTSVIHPDGDIAKNWWVQNFGASGRLAWTVTVPQAADYHFWALMGADNGQTFSLKVKGASSSQTITTTGGWNKFDVGTLSLPAGTSTIELTHTGTATGDTYVKSIEFLRESDVPAYNARIAAARDAGDTTWMQDGKYGLFYQYGSWGYPDNVGPRKSVDQQAADFNVQRFVRTVKETGAGYVIWSWSWWGYKPDMPSDSVDAIIGDGSYTAQRDLIGEVAAALKAEGIGFALYYHEGKEESGWWQKQNWPSTFRTTGVGDRSTFFTNWKNVVSEIGQRLGDNLDGFFFDDGGSVYYPAPFESLMEAARTGNPERVVAWNNGLERLPRVTEFQDVWFGEISAGLAESAGGSPVGGDGIIRSGSNKGLLDHGMLMFENDWGIHNQNQKIGNGSRTSNQTITQIQSASSRNIPLDFNLSMYEDGTMSEKTLSILNDVRQAIRGTAPSVPTGTSLVNDNATNITYTGAWSYSTGRGGGDLQDDVHYTLANGASASFTFTGTGVDVLGPASCCSKNFDVYVDNQLIGRYSEYKPAYTPQSVIYSARHLAPGTHTVKLVKVDGNHFQIDGFRVVPNPVVHNDDSAQVAFTGTWTHATGRTSDYQNDVTWSGTNGDSMTITFTGTGLRVKGPMSTSDGTAAVTVDGAPAGTISATYSGSYIAQQTYWVTDHLDPGTHTVTITKTGGTYLQLDSFTVIP